MTTARSKLALALAVATAGALVAGAMLCPRPRRDSKAIFARAVETARVDSAPSEPIDERRAAEIVAEHVPCASPLASTHDVVNAAIGAMAASLTTLRFERWSWDVEVGATAASLAEDSHASLVAALRDRDRPEAERVAAAELLCALDAPSASLDAASWAFLRSTSQRFDDAPALAATAARALSRLGSDADRDELVVLLSTSNSAEQRRSAAWALGNDPSASLVLRLADLDDDGVDLALAVIERWHDAARSSTGASAVVAAIALDVERPSALRERALSALDASEIGARAHELLELASDPQTPASLANAVTRALASSSETTSQLAALAKDDRLPLERRMSAAEALGRVEGSLATEVLAEALDAPSNGATANLRRRACFALSHHANATPILQRVSTLDHDPCVREAAQLALERIVNASENMR